MQPSASRETTRPLRPRRANFMQWFPGGGRKTRPRPVEGWRRAENTPRRCLRLEERPLLELAERGAQLLGRVHDDRAAPRHRLLERLARDEQEAHALVAGLDDDLVARVEQHERAVPRLDRREEAERSR